MSRLRHQPEILSKVKLSPNHKRRKVQKAQNFENFKHLNYQEHPIKKPVADHVEL